MHKYVAAIVAGIVVLPLYLLDVIDLVGVVLAFLLIEEILYLPTFIRTIKQIVA
jgi:hypothetical protein